MTLAELEKAHEKDPDDLDVAARLADQYSRRKRAADGRKLAEKVLDKKPGHPLASLVKARLLSAGRRRGGGQAGDRSGRNGQPGRPEDHARPRADRDGDEGLDQGRRDVRTRPQDGPHRWRLDAPPDRDLHQVRGSRQADRRTPRTGRQRPRRPQEPDATGEAAHRARRSSPRPKRWPATRSGSTLQTPRPRRPFSKPWRVKASRTRWRSSRSGLMGQANRASRLLARLRKRGSGRTSLARCLGAHASSRLAARNSGTRRAKC